MDKPQPAVSHLVEDDFYLRVNPETHQVVGATIFNASLYFGQLARAFALKSLDDPNVRFFLERRVESFALEKVQAPRSARGFFIGGSARTFISPANLPSIQTPEPPR